MKKITALILTLVLMMSLGTVAFATEASDGMGDHLIEVIGSYVPGSTTSDTLFSVEVNWDKMTFTYYDAVAGEWDAEKHEYLPTTPAYWEGEGTITVTNHSNARITATPSYTAADGYDNATMTFSPGSLNIASAENGGEKVGTITVTPGGYLPKMDASAAIGSITVTIAEDTNVTVEEMEALVAQANDLYNKINEKDQLSEYPDFLKVKRSATTSLTNFKNQETTQEVLNTAYADLLAAYQAALEQMAESE